MLKTDNIFEIRTAIRSEVKTLLSTPSYTQGSFVDLTGFGLHTIKNILREGHGKPTPQRLFEFVDRMGVLGWDGQILYVVNSSELTEMQLRELLAETIKAHTRRIAGRPSVGYGKPTVKALGDRLKHNRTVMGHMLRPDIYQMNVNIDKVVSALETLNDYKINITYEFGVKTE